MKNCPNCGALCQDNAKFCASCGAAFETFEELESGMQAGGMQDRNVFDNSMDRQAPDAAQQTGSTGEGSYDGQQAGDQPYDGQQYQQVYGGIPSGHQNQQYDGQAYGQQYQQYVGQYQQYGGQYQQYGGQYQQYGGQYYGYGQERQGGRYPAMGAPYVNTAGIKKRSIALAIIFSIITFGIYSIYWMIKLNDDINQLADEPGAMSGGVVFLLSLVTLGIFGLYWLYKMGERVDRIRGDQDGASSIIYLVIGLVGFSIVAYALMQDTINKCLPA